MLIYILDITFWERRRYICEYWWYKLSKIKCRWIECARLCV